MTTASSISLTKFTATVQEAVAAAQKRNPKFNVGPITGITVSWVIRGIPVPWPLAQTVTVSEVQSFADDVAGHIAGAAPELGVTAGPGGSGHGAVVTFGRHIICGIPPVTGIFQVEK